MNLEHPALVLAAERLTSLRDAARRLGAPDPVAALQHVDCSPDELRTSARQVGVGQEVLTTAHGEFREGLDRAETCRSPDDFGPEADRVDARYRAAVASAEATAAAGLRIADRLDALANDAASDAIAIAAEAGLYVTAVLAGDRSRDAVAGVTDACVAVASSMRAHAESITGIAADLDALTSPA